MISTEEFDKIFDEGKEDVLQYCDLSKATVINQGIHRVNVDFPKWMVTQLDKEAARLGVTRQAVIKFWLAERLDECA